MSPRQKIGSQLVSEGLIQPDHLQAALKAQLQFRGRLGSNLIELGFIAVDDVSLALGRQLGVRAATRADFVELNASLLERLPARAANMYSAIPMRAAGSAKTVVVAMMDPTNLVALDELQTILGARVEALVAPELRIVHLLDKLYGVKRKQRTFIRMVLDRPVRSHVEASAPNVEAPLSPPPPPPPAPRAPAERRSRPKPPDRKSAAEPESAPARTTGASKATHEPAAKWDALPAIESMSLEPPPIAPDADRSGPEIDSRALLMRAVETLERVQQRDGVADAIVSYLDKLYDCTLVLIVKGDVALGWKGKAGHVPPEVIESVVVPLSTPSVFQQAFERGAAFRGFPPEEGDLLHGRLWKLLRTAPEGEVVAAPIVLGNRTVNLIYAHPAPGAQLMATADSDLAVVAAAAAAAYQRIIKSRQTSR